MKFLQPLNRPSVKFKNKVANILIAYVIVFVYVFSINKFINFLDPPIPVPDFGGADESSPSVIFLLFTFFFAVIWAPLWEELVFRHAPALLAKALGEKFLLPIMIISSALFGWGHGNGPESLLIQGVMGFILFYIYIKNGYSYWSSVTLHALWNGVLYLLEYHKYIW
jgi:membrane protease YdiL (CAAX protease family)